MTIPDAPSEPGIRRCMCCQWLFVSPDVARIRRCPECTDTDDYSPKSSTIIGDANAEDTS